MKSGRASEVACDFGTLRMTKIRMTAIGRRNGRSEIMPRAYGSSTTEPGKEV